MASPRADQRSPNIGLRFSDEANLNFNWSKIDDQFGTILALLNNVGGGMMPVTNVPVLQAQPLVLSTPVVMATITPDASAANHTLILLGVIYGIAYGTGTDKAYDVKIEVGPAGSAGYITTIGGGLQNPRLSASNEADPICMPIVAAFNIPMTPVPIQVTLTRTVGTEGAGGVIVYTGQGHLSALVI